jgi:plastocyanin
MRTKGTMLSTLLLLGSLVASGVAPAEQNRAGRRDVKIENFSFDPRTVSVTAGTEVRWENYDDSPHSIVDAALGLRSKALDTDESFAHVFAKPGTYHYICGLHPQMKGTIEVLPK